LSGQAARLSASTVSPDMSQMIGCAAGPVISEGTDIGRCKTKKERDS